MRPLFSLAVFVTLLVALLVPAGPGAASDTDRVLFVNESGRDLFLRVRPSAGEDACLDDGYRTVELPEAGELTVELEGQAALCWCAVERPRDSCAFPEIATGGETVFVAGPEES